MNKKIKDLIRPVRRLLTKIIVEPDALKPHISKQIWEETNAFRWSSAYIVKNQISGDYLEFGVWKGNGFIEAFRQITEYSNTFFEVGIKSKQFKNSFDKMRYHAFDSFSGLPKTENTENPIQYFEGNYKSSEEIFREKISTAGIDLSRVTITKGWFDESLNAETAKRIGLNEISIAFIDCNLYESAANVLNFIKPHIKTGTVLIFDDWFRNRGIPSTGVQGAVLDWLDTNKNISLQHFYTCDTTATIFIVQVDCGIRLSQIDCV